MHTTGRGLIFYMAGMSICMGNVMTSGLRTLPRKDASQGNAILNTLQQFAGAMGTSTAAMIVAGSQLGIKNAARTAVGTQHAFFVLTALCLHHLAVILALCARLESFW